MGQPITVVQQPSNTEGVLRYETNRSLTGMGRERYSSPADILRDRPPDRLAARLFEAGGVDQVIIYGHAITLTADKKKADDYQAVIEGLYTFWHEGDVPTVQES